MSSENFVDMQDENANVIRANSNSSTFNSSNTLYEIGDNTRISPNTSSQKEYDSGIAMDSDEGNQTNWAELPSLVVENIYSFLSRTDQSHMSLVCSRWAKEFNSPSLWKTMKFHLSGLDYLSEICPEVRFARKNAFMFKHVEIIATRANGYLIDEVERQLKLFLHAMTFRSQLISIKFIDLESCTRFLDDILYEDLFKTLVDFFYSQDNLKTVVFQESYFGIEKGVQLLKAIFHFQNNTVRNLTLRGFVSEAQNTVLTHRYMKDLSEVCHNIRNVQSFKVDYTQIFEDIINCIYVKLSSVQYKLGKKKYKPLVLNIYCSHKENLEFKSIPPETWYFLRKSFPTMTVKMNVTIHNNLNREMKKFLVKEIPLQSLEFRFATTSASSLVDISTLLTHLKFCKYQNRLEVLNVLWMSSITDFVTSIVQFVQSCKNLRIFHLRAKHVSSGIENALKALLEHHPKSIKSITLWFNYLQEGEDETILRTLAEKYYQLFNAQCIEFFLVIDPNRRLRRREANIIIPY